MPRVKDAPVEQYYATRTCEFDSTLSGVYEGTVTDCATGAETESIVALGLRDIPFMGTLVMGIEWPRTDRYLFGLYEPSSEEGRLGDIENGNLGVSMFTFSEADGVLHLDHAREDLIETTCLRRESCHECVRRFA